MYIYGTATVNDLFMDSPIKDAILQDNRFNLEAYPQRVALWAPPYPTAPTAHTR